MNHNTDLLKLVDYIAASEIKIDDGFAVLESDISSDSLSNFADLLKCFGIKEIDSCEKNQIIFSIKTNNLESDSCIYASLDSFWTKCSKTGVFNSNYIILQQKIFFNSNDDSVKSIELFLNWKKILDIVSNHSFQNKYIFYIPNSDGGKELILPCHDLLESVLNIEYSLDSLKASNEFNKILSLQDAQQKERISILRSAIFDSVSGNDKEDIFCVINKGGKIYDRYNDLLDLYTKRFSVNKILSELEQKQLEYTTKINDFVSSSQSKAFAIPGALIAIGGLAKASGFWDSSLIFIGLYLIYKVTCMSNQVLDDSYNSLSNNLSELINRYSKFDEGLEVKQAASNIARDISDKIEKAKKLIDKINKMGKFMLWIGGSYLFIKWILFLADYFKLYTILVPQ